MSATIEGVATISDFLLWGILGLGSGAVIAYIALGIVLGYRGSGVINFAQGALGTYSAYVFVGLRTKGQYMLPLPGLPGFARIGPKTGLGTLVSLAITMATAIALGLISHYLVFRPLRHAPTLAKIAASIGLMLALQSIVAYRFGAGDDAVQPPRLLPDGIAFTFNGVRFPVDRLILSGAALAAAAGLLALFRFTRFGLATRAAAENERGAVLLGVNPDFQSGMCWVIGSVLAAIGTILVSYTTALTPTKFTLLVVPALAAVLIARFTSFGVVVAAALGLGILQNIVANVGYRYPRLTFPGLAEAVPFLVIIIAMVVTGKSLPERGQVIQGRLQGVPPTRRRIVAPAVTFAIVTFALYTVSPGYRLAIINSLIGAIVCLSMVVITGYMAQISLEQMTLAGVAGFMVAAISTNWNVPFPVAPLLSILTGTLVGLIAAAPALRVRGVHLAIVTLSGGYAIEQFIFNNPKYTGGFDGTTVRDPSFFGHSLPYSRGTTIGQPAFGLFALVMTTIAALVVANIRRSATGRRMLAVRTNERAAASMGVDVGRTKLAAFGISATISSTAGVMTAYQLSLMSSATTASFSVWATIAILAIAFLGGITSVTGGLIAGALVAGGIMPTILDHLIFSKSHNGLALQNLIGGIGLIFTAIENPEGISGALRITGEKLKGLLTKRDNQTKVATQ